MSVTPPDGGHHPDDQRPVPPPAAPPDPGTGPSISVEMLVILVLGVLAGVITASNPAWAIAIGVGAAVIGLLHKLIRKNN